MKLIITRQFDKDVEKELNKPMRLELIAILDRMRKAASLSELTAIKKLKHFPNAYRIRLGDYRIGFIVEDNTIIVSRVMHRKEIYRYFP